MRVSLAAPASLLIFAACALGPPGEHDLGASVSALAGLGDECGPRPNGTFRRCREGLTCALTDAAGNPSATGTCVDPTPPPPPPVLTDGGSYPGEGASCDGFARPPVRCLPGLVCTPEPEPSG